MDPRVVELLTVTGVILVLLYIRYKNLELRHQERMTALEKGAALPLAPEPVPPSPRIYLLRGLIWLFAGISLTVFLFFVTSVIKTGERDRWASLEMKYWRIQQLRRQGFPEEQLKELLAGQPPAPREQNPRPLALVGLIPIGVGLAYLIFYSSEEKRLRALPPPEAPGPTGLAS